MIGATLVMALPRQHGDIDHLRCLLIQERITFMLCTAADGSKCPGFVVGTAKRPKCFDLSPTIPMGYTHQKCAWFDKTVMLTWLNDVLMPWWRRRKGTQPCVLIADNCPAHQGIDKDPAFPKRLYLIFLPPKLTSKRQPADQGQLYAVKKRFKFSLLHALLLLMEQDNYLELVAAGKQRPKGTAGISFGHKPHLLDAMELLKEALNEVTEQSMQNCWRKADCLPDRFKEQLSEEAVPSRFVPKLEENECDALCDMIKKLKVGCPAVKGSFCDDHESYTDSELREAAEAWINVEEADDVCDALSGLHMDRLLASKTDEEQVSSMQVDNTDVHGSNQEPTVTQAQAEAALLTLTQFFQGKGFEDALTHQLRADHAMRRHLSTIAKDQKKLEDFFPPK
jgi:hypothetical protein